MDCDAFSMQPSGGTWSEAAVIDPQYSGGVLQGYMIGFGINAVVLIVSGLPGLLLLWPNTERARLTGQGGAARARCLDLPRR